MSTEQTKPTSSFDAKLDGNLKSLAPHLSLPSAPTAEQRAAWLSTESTPTLTSNRDARLTTARSNKKDRLMLNIRLFTAGSIAAAVAVCAFFFGPLQPQRVHAAQIIQTLRTSAWEAVRVKIENVDAEGILVNAEVEVRFCQPTTLAKLIQTAQSDAFTTNCDSSNPLEQLSNSIESVYFDARVNAGPDAEPDTVGLDIVARGGVSFPSSAWVFVQPRSLPTQLVQEEPAVNFITMMFGHGVLLDLPDLDSIMSQLEGVDDANDDADDDTHASGTKSVSIGASGSSNENTLKISADIDDKPRPDNGLHIDLGDGHPVTPELIERILSGGASADDLEQLFAGNDGEELNYQIDEREPGLYVLTVRDFEKDDEMMQNAVVEIGYRQQSGVEWLTVVNVGSRNGTIRVEFTTPTYDKAATVRADMISDGVRVMDVNQIATILQQQFANWQSDQAVKSDKSDKK